MRTWSTLTSVPTARTTSRRPAEASATRSLQALLEANGLAELPEEPFPNDGWSGATLTAVRRGDERFVIKRTSRAVDWIARATNDVALREGLVAGSALVLAEPLVAPYLGVASNGDGVAILMPDLSDDLIAWERPGEDPVVPVRA